MQIEVSGSATAGYGATAAWVTTAVEAPEASASNPTKLLPGEIDALRVRVDECVAELHEKLHRELERLRPAAMARAERLAHEEAAAGASD